MQTGAYLYTHLSTYIYICISRHLDRYKRSKKVFFVSVSTRCLTLYFAQLSPNTQTENKLLEVILHSCEKRWYSSSGFITYLPCDVNASPGGLMSVALVQARVSLQTTGVAAWLSPGISRVASGAGSAHFHHCAHRVWIMKGLFEPMHVRSSFYLQSRHVTFTVACTERTECFKLWPLWSSNLHTHSMWLDEQDMPAPSSMFVVKTPLIHLLQKKKSCCCGGGCLTWGAPIPTGVPTTVEKSLPPFGMCSSERIHDNVWAAHRCTTSRAGLLLWHN